MKHDKARQKPQPTFPDAIEMTQHIFERASGRSSGSGSLLACVMLLLLLLVTMGGGAAVATDHGDAPTSRAALLPEGLGGPAVAAGASYWDAARTLVPELVSQALDDLPRRLNASVGPDDVKPLRIAILRARECLDIFSFAYPFNLTTAGSGRPERRFDLWDLLRRGALQQGHRGGAARSAAPSATAPTRRSPPRDCRPGPRLRGARRVPGAGAGTQHRVGLARGRRTAAVLLLPPLCTCVASLLQDLAHSGVDYDSKDAKARLGACLAWV